mmetsp:Transcript_5734/g.10349  ORF Transcript_5734/g.10349 Transcript_5734/m.10349 type:complete len:457 (-) Transcript_5734:780-2150(-)
MRRAQSKAKSPSRMYITSSKGLSSASSGGGILTARLGNTQRRNLLCRRGMDAHRLDNIFKRAPQLHRRAEPLHDLSGIGSQIMQSQHPVGMLVHNRLAKSLVLPPRGRNAPFERHEEFVIHLDIFLPELLQSIVLGISHRAVFERREDRRANVAIVHGFGGPAEETAGEVPPRVDGHGGELRTPVHDVADGVNVGRGGLFELCGDFVVFGIGRNAHLVKTKFRRVARASNGAEYRVVLLGIVVREGDLDFVSHLFHFGGYHLLPEPNSLRHHVLPDQIGALAIEPAEEDGTHGHVHLLADAAKKSGAFQTNVRGAHAQHLAGIAIQRKNVVAGNGQFASRTGDGSGPSPNSNEAAAEGDGALVSLLIDRLQGVRVNEAPEHVQIGHLLLPQIDAVLKVQSANVILDVLLEHLPAVIAPLAILAHAHPLLLLLLAHPDAVVRSVHLGILAEERGVVH